ncbi:MAG: hypothetical protein JOZ86_06330 [Candidatus Eremiobacteraeota bacterium]|nr:hypothetical protein [Candidatus Eremiobacteraeota bacterium]
MNLPPLPYAEWEPTKTTLHLWSQIVGKVRLRATPHLNQWWNAALHLTSRGFAAHGMVHDGIDFALEFDLIDHHLVGSTAAGRSAAFGLVDGLSVAAFYAKTTALLSDLGVPVHILAKPYGVPIETPFARDEEHRSYDRDAVRRWWEIARFTADTLTDFASGFAGKQSPVNLYWHSFDLAMGRFNGKLAPPKPEANLVEREAYRYDVISFGFWAGDANVPAPAYYTYTAPEPPTLTTQQLRPEQATWVPSGAGHLGVLPYDVVRATADPHATLLDFYASGYEAGTRTAAWDVAALASRFPD